MRDYETFAVIICATDMEHSAVMRIFDWKEFKMEYDDQQLYYTEIMREDRKLKIIYGKQQEMGMCASAALATKLIDNFRPAYIIMPGISAGTGLRGYREQMYGDVIVANKVWNYSNGKYVNPVDADIKFGTVGFIPRPTVIEMEEELREILKESFKHENNECRIHFGSLASGSTVVASSEFVNMQIKSQFNDTEGLEMEAYGIAYSAKHASDPKPYAIIAKSICDFADDRKNDVYQKFAAYTSCEYVKLLCERCLPERHVQEL